MKCGDEKRHFLPSRAGAGERPGGRQRIGSVAAPSFKTLYAFPPEKSGENAQTPKGACRLTPGSAFFGSAVLACEQGQSRQNIRRRQKHHQAQTRRHVLHPDHCRTCSPCFQGYYNVPLLFVKNKTKTFWARPARF